MDSSHLDQVDRSSPEPYSDSSGSPDSPDTSDIFGDPLVHPRVGEEYQAVVPPLSSEAELHHRKMNPFDSKGHHFVLGLPVPVMWVCNHENSIKDENLGSLNNSHAVNPNGPVSNAKVDPPPNETSVSNVYSLVPGLSSESWSDFEAGCFLLGLYMFGKNLLQVKNFIERKEMGQMLAFYYGRFYGSSGYRRWSECRKMRSRKCVLGHRFFTGYRQQELFSRLAPRLSAETKNELLEASRAFADGKISLYDYVFMLKDLVGILALVEAVGIGKGKEDLTTLFLDRNSSRSEIPSGKDCSSLTCSEIVKYLTGDFRLSKARSNDLFWEAVWPRLLARGWHSEQPRGDGYVGSKNSLVFLMPGIKKFSRRRLSKGDHYFDSVTDVLAKVANEPELLELEADEITRPNNAKEENGWSSEVISDDFQDTSDHEHRCYLKPRVSSCAVFSDIMTFTVVDTSLANEANPTKVRELRSLPLEAKTSSKVKESKGSDDILPNGDRTSAVSAHAKGSVLRDIDLNPSKMPAEVNRPTVHNSRAIKHQFSRRIKHGLSGCSAPVTKRRRLGSYLESSVTCVLSLPARVNPKLKVTFKNSATPKVSEPCVEVISPDPSGARNPTENILKGCSNGQGLNSGRSQENEKLAEPAKFIDLNVPQELTEPESSEKAKAEDREDNTNKLSDAEKPKQQVEERENNGNRNFDGEIQRICHSKELITSSSVSDPSESLDDEKPKISDTEEPMARSSESDPSKSLDDEKPVVNYVASDPSKSFDDEKPKFPETKQPVVNSTASDQQPRRQSTRSRPLTTKALEALEIGFLNPVRQYRKRAASSAQDQKPKRTSRQPRSKGGIFPDIVGFGESSHPEIDARVKKSAAVSELSGLPRAPFAPEAP